MFLFFNIRISLLRYLIYLNLSVNDKNILTDLITHKLDISLNKKLKMKIIL